MKNFRPLILAALFPLIGCSSGHHEHHASLGGPAPLYCPDVQRLQQGLTLTLFLPNRQDVAARVTTAQISNVSGSCQLEKKKHAVLVKVNTSFLADNGPANNSAPLVLPWFLAITDGDNIIQKANYTQTLSFDGNSSVVSDTAKTVKIELPDRQDTQNLQILVGFVMTPDELAYTAAHPSAAP